MNRVELTPKQQEMKEEAMRQSEAEDHYIKENFGGLLFRAGLKKNKKQRRKKLKRVCRKAGAQDTHTMPLS